MDHCRHYDFGIHLFIYFLNKKLNNRNDLFHNSQKMIVKRIIDSKMIDIFSTFLIDTVVKTIFNSL